MADSRQTAMPSAHTVIEAKLVPPRARPELLERKRLLRELDRSADAALTLVDAPIGYGKTILVQSWCAKTQDAVAWVSLDPSDDDPVRLWTYLATAVDRVRPGLGRLALARLQVSGVPIELVVAELLNGVGAYDQALTIVLDDLHVVKNERSLASLEHAIAHLPRNGRVIATTRSDPALSLGRLRAQGSLVEIRARELAFTVDETRELIVDRERVPLDDDGVHLLTERTEGWPAGLYLAALWLRTVDDPSAQVRDFHGDHRHVAEYLTTEVLDILDSDVRNFLLRTSVLERFSAPLCDAVLEREGSGRQLDELAKSNLFLVSLDASGQWYRYHHLFGELLRLELANVDPSAVPGLHARAGGWWLAHGFIDDALSHAGAAKDWSRAAAILADQHLALLRSGRLATLLAWVARVPAPLLVERPELPLAAALAAGLLGRPFHERHRLILLAERARDQRVEAWTVYHDAALGLAQSVWVESDVAKTVEIARHTADIARVGVEDVAIAALGNLAFLLFLTGDNENARAVAIQTVDHPAATVRPHGLVLALATLSMALTEARSLEAAEREARRAIEVAEEHGIAQVASGGAARVALATTLAASGRLREAEREAVAGELLRRQPEPEAAHLHAILVLADIRVRRGRLAAARHDLERAKHGLASFTEAGRLPGLAGEIEHTLIAAEAAATPLAEMPTAAELSVLRLLATELSQREIGAQLYLSLNTVKTHTRALYRKLDVTSRDAAVVRAAALGLLDEDDSPG